MSSININNTNNQVTSVNANQNIVITDNNNQTSVSITQPITTVVTVATPGTIGPQGPSGSQGPQGNPGPQGESAPFIDLGNGLWQTTSSLQVTGSIDITGSLTVNTINVGQNTINFIDDVGNIVNSLYISGSDLALSSGSLITPEGGLTGSLYGTSSWADSSSYALTASYAMNGGSGETVDTSSLATTGSNIFIGNQEIIGDLSITGSDYVNSIIKFVSGATISTSGPNLDMTAGPGGWSELGSNNGENYVWVEDDFIYLASNWSNGAHVWAISRSGLLTAGGNINMNGFTITGSLHGTSSWANNAITASYVTNNPGRAPGGIDGQLQYKSGSNFSGTQTLSYDSDTTLVTATNIKATGFFSGSFSGDLKGKAESADYADSAASADFASYAAGADFAISASYASTASYAPDYILNSTTGSFVQNSQTSSFIQNNATSSFVQNSQTSSFVTTSSFNSFTSSINGVTGSFLTTGSSDISQTISGSLIINQNLTVLGSSSVQYITSSQLNISTNLITVNTATPSVRFGGLAVYDSGSIGTGLTGSILWDSQNNVWIYSNPSGASYDGALVLMGPRNNTGLGNEVGINSWYAAIGNGSHHMTSSVIWNSGSLIRLETNTQVTGSLLVTSGITGSLTGSLLGTSSWANNSSVTISSSYAATASLAPNYVLNSATSSFVQNSQTSSFVTNSQTSSFVQNSQTSSMTVLSSSYSLTASYALTSEGGGGISENLAIAYAIALG